MAYHYTDSGLDNVFLENGYTLHKTPYGEGVSIKDTDGLHRLIGEWLVSNAKRLNGAELKFLRLQMDCTQRNLAGMLGADEQALRRWEKHRTKPINGSADRLLRGLYTEYAGGDGTIRAIVERLCELDQVEETKVRLREDHDHWQVAA
jgi:DNA-binding transcriptional regulator YiaG